MKVSRRTFLGAVGALTATAGVSAYVLRRSSSIEKEVEAAVAHMMSRDPLIPGAGVAFFSPEVRFAGAFGRADADTGEKADADTLFYAASSTKSFSALALAILHHEGKLDLDEPLASLVPDAGLPQEVQPDLVTMRHLLAHTSGIDNVPIGARLGFSGEHDPATLWQLLAKSRQHRRAPFGQFRYSNEDYNIAAMICERLAGISWQDAVRTRLFEPTGMSGAFCRMSEAQGHRVARPHLIGPGRTIVRISHEKSDRTMNSAGGIMISPQSALRWIEMLTRGGLVESRQAVPAAALADASSHHADVDAEFGFYRRDGYGLGWYTCDFRGARMWQHFGGYAGYRAHVSFVPAWGMGAAIFLNSSGSDAAADALANYLYDRFRGAGDAQAQFDLSLDRVLATRDEGIAEDEADRAAVAAQSWTLKRALADHTGSYTNEDFGTLQLAPHGSGLRVQWGDLVAPAMPVDRPDSLRADLLPTIVRAVLSFEGDGPQPDAFTMMGSRFARS